MFLRKLKPLGLMSMGLGVWGGSTLCAKPVSDSDAQIRKSLGPKAVSEKKNKEANPSKTGTEQLFQLIHSKPKFVIDGYSLDAWKGLGLVDADASFASESIMQEMTQSMPLEQAVSQTNENDYVQEKIVTPLQEENDRGIVKICWYLNGAVVSVPLKEKDVQKEGIYQIHNLSSSVDEQSIVVNSPDTISVKEFHLSSSDSFEKSQEKAKKLDKNGNQHPLEESKAQERILRLNVLETGNVTPEDDWLLQYTVSDVSWSAHHIIELAEDRQHMTFRTLFQINNESGIQFSKSKILFLEKELPKKKEAEELVGSRVSLVYEYPFVSDIPPFQKETVVWASAKRVPISSSNGLYVGGEFLKKMTQKAYPRVENWIQFKNTKEEGLGNPLPGGRVSVYTHRRGFTSLWGYTSMESAPSGETVTIRMPPISHHHSLKNVNDDNKVLDATLIQESYRVLTPSVAEAEYRLVIKNQQNEPVNLSVTIDPCKDASYEVSRSNVNVGQNERGDAFWNLTLPPRGGRELRYKLSLRIRS